MVEEIEILTRYAEADMNGREYLFLRFRDLRGAFQEIDRKDLAAQMGSRSLAKQHNRGKCSQLLSLLRKAYRRIIARKPSSQGNSSELNETLTIGVETVVTFWRPFPSCGRKFLQGSK